MHYLKKASGLQKTRCPILLATRFFVQNQDFGEGIFIPDILSYSPSPSGGEKLIHVRIRTIAVTWAFDAVDVFWFA